MQGGSTSHVKSQLDYNKYKLNTAHQHSTGLWPGMPCLSWGNCTPSNNPTMSISMRMYIFIYLICIYVYMYVIYVYMSRRWPVSMSMYMYIYMYMYMYVSMSMYTYTVYDIRCVMYGV